jgi:aminopeptidase N
MNTEPISEFQRYLEKEVLPATTDLEKLEDANRKHVQKLIYTNLVDRFDSTIDSTLLKNCRTDYLSAEATKNMTQQITEADLLSLLMRSDDLQSAIDEKLKAALRNSVLRQRHSRKLAALFATFEAENNHWNQPRVNINTGVVIEKITPQNKAIPHSICGYADWLYSRRNAIVHGAGTNKLLFNDIEQLKKLFKCEPAETFRIKLSSIAIAAQFYGDVATLLKETAGKAGR